MCHYSTLKKFYGFVPDHVFMLSQEENLTLQYLSANLETIGITKRHIVTVGNFITFTTKCTETLMTESRNTLVINSNLERTIFFHIHLVEEDSPPDEKTTQ